MKIFDEVKLITDKYRDKGASKGDIGTIVEIYPREDIPTGYHVAFTDKKTGDDYALIIVHEEDIEVTKPHTGDSNPMIIEYIKNFKEEE
jgi:hypothetical protein